MVAMATISNSIVDSSPSQIDARSRALQRSHDSEEIHRGQTCGDGDRHLTSKGKIPQWVLMGARRTKQAPIGIIWPQLSQAAGNKRWVEPTDIEKESKGVDVATANPQPLVDNNTYKPDSAAHSREEKLLNERLLKVPKIRTSNPYGNAKGSDRTKITNILIKEVNARTRIRDESKFSWIDPRLCVHYKNITQLSKAFGPS